jgi:hypothetical protein
MKKIRNRIVVFITGLCILSAAAQKANKELADKILSNKEFEQIQQKAMEVVKTGFNAGDKYGEVRIRDYNTFIELSSNVFDDDLEQNLLVFFRLQGQDGNIVDGLVIPMEKAIENSRRVQVHLYRLGTQLLRT